ncbi:HpcH/HpaI aldolase/citrate lyase family protein [Sphingomonas oligophenolica]|uniref:CoA ester lyase n=1 Tax=Sphingomonas oligophenolica TaxID=301154 RepID=A0A502BYQ5_9SPHN|nr:CoA ester lyase [Sphingomonas oligophenolica]TPG06365.1 CoA ester lyase [Sphingomonas oligophenolica]
MDIRPRPRPRRSALYMPATNAKAIAKARTLPCDVVILDLEDAVAPAAKHDARAAAVAAVGEGGFGRRELVIRVNALSTAVGVAAWGEEDCRALVAARPDAVLIPKVDDARAVAAYRALLGDLPIWAMVETARAVLRLDDLAAAPGLAALVVGTNDLAKELRATPGRDRLPFHGFLAQTVAAARAHGLAAIDGVCNAIDDVDGFAAECDQGARFGFDGKTLIHPSQIAPCNGAFSPTAAAIAWARRVVAAFAAPAAADHGVIRVDGAMVERLHWEQAHQTLAIARAIAGE